MSLSINNNLLARNASNQVNKIYGRMSASTRRLSSGLRVGVAADDAAGLAVRELMRAQVTSLNQGVRNASDAISLIQTADGALQVIDEKLIRMKELAEQAATGTYNSTQRQIINSEYVAMASEINRIANATSFNGVKLLDGSLSGAHDGSGLLSLGALKVHFGPSNNSAEDYYYLDIAKATIGGLGLGIVTGPGTVAGPGPAPAPTANGPYFNEVNQADVLRGTGVRVIAIVPAGTTNFTINMYDMGDNDNIEIFTTSGVHLVGTSVNTNDGGWQGAVIDNGIHSVADMDANVITTGNYFNANASYSDAALNGGSSTNAPFTSGTAGNTYSYNGMNIGYSGTGNPDHIAPNFLNKDQWEYVTIDNVTEDLVIMIVGGKDAQYNASWSFMPTAAPGNPPAPGTPGGGDLSDEVRQIHTQSLAQQALDDITGAIVAKDNIRAYLGAMQNRLENTVSNLQIQSENLLAAESRISDVDVSLEMTEFTRNSVMLQASVAMLSQANSIPRELLKLIG